MSLKSLVPWSRNRDDQAVRYSSENPVFAFHREMNRMFDDLFRGFDDAGNTVRGSQWTRQLPSVEVRETDREFRVIAELPGLEERDVEVTYADGVLSIKGEKHVEEGNALYTERWSGLFERRVPLSEDVDADKVNAKFKNGLLTVTLAKKPEAQRVVKKITIN